MSKIPSSRSSNPSPRPAGGGGGGNRSWSRASAPILSTGTNREDDNALRLGDRVTINDKTGYVAFLGPTQFAPGQWCGINLDQPHGKNDGSCEGVRYFRAQPNHGLFCRPEKVQRVHVEPGTVDFQIGDRVLISGKKFGFLQYIGPIHVAQGVWCGVKLDEPIGKNNGKIEGRRYFRCQHRFGLFAPIHKVEKVQLTAQEKRLLARQSMISTTSFNQSNDSSSEGEDDGGEGANGFPIFPTRSPLSIESNGLDDLQKELKRLREQYEAKNQEYETLISEHFVMKQKLDQLQHQLDEHRLEAMVKDESVTIPEGFQLVSNDEFEQYQTIEGVLEEKEKEIEQWKQRELFYEDQIRDYQLKIKSNEEKVDRRELTLLQEKIDELTGQLKHYQQVLLPQFEQEREELKSIHRVKQELEEKIQDYEQSLAQAMHSTQLVQGQLIALQEEKLQSEQKSNEIIQRLKEDYQQLNLISQEKERIRLEQKEKYEDEIRDYQKDLEIATQRTEQIQQRLNQIENEKIQSEEKLHQSIEQLKEDYEQRLTETNQSLETKMIDETIKRLQEEYDQLNASYQEKERQAELLRLQQQNEYEQQMRDYEKNLEEATRQTQSIQEQIHRFQEEKLDHDRKTKETIDKLKEDYEKQYEDLRAQLNQLQSQERSYRERESYHQSLVKQLELERDRALENKLDDQSMAQLIAERDRALDELKEAQETIQILKEREIHRETLLKETKTLYEKELDEYQKDLELAVRERDDLQEKVQENETLLASIKEEFEKHMTHIQAEDRATIEALTKEKEEWEEQHRNEIEVLQKQLKTNQEEQERFTRSNDEQENLLNRLDEMQQLHQTLNEEHEHLQREYQDQTKERDVLQTQLRNYEEEVAQMKNEHAMSIENMQRHHEQELLQMKNEQEKLIEQLENLKKITDGQTDLADQLTQLQQTHQSLLEKQAALGEALDEKTNDETNLRRQIEEYQMKMAELKSEYMLEMENMRLDQEQLILQLRNQLQESQGDIEQLKQINEETRAEMLKRTEETSSTDQRPSDLQEKYETLLTKQTELERAYQEKLDQEKTLQNKLSEYEMKLALMKSENMVEIENMRYDYEQAILKLKAQLQAAPPAKGKK